jgi:hypothetical protein
VPKYRPHAQEDEDLMSYAEIARKLGYNNVQSARWIVKKALRKLRKATAVHRDEFRDLYAPEPETTQQLSSIGSQWKVSELRPVELMPRREK